MSELAGLKCIPCRGDAPPLSDAEVAALRPEIPDWSIQVREGIPRLERSFRFKDFAQALDFTNRVGVIAEEEDHHPLLVTEWGRVTVSWWTHAIKGLHRNDFIMAAKTDARYSG